MPPTDLSDQQSAVLDPDVRVVEAAPGSGKTRVLVARYIRNAATSDRGVALLSFTNAAIDEVRRRTVMLPHLTKAPNFVGTIDSFLHRFVVTPQEVRRLRRLPSYMAAWDDLPATMSCVRLHGEAGAGIPLSAFRLDVTNTIVLAESSLSNAERAYLRQLLEAGHQQRLSQRAAAIIRGLNGKGVYDASSARLKAYQLLSGPEGDQLLDRLVRRFGEFLIDEAQDCDQAEMEIIRRLSTRVPTLVVADPDQAIYEFRGSDPQLFMTYRDEQVPDALASLSTNYRSTTSIVGAVSSLRAAGLTPIVAHNQNSCCPVYVVSGSASEQRSTFLSLLDEHGIPVSEAIVLAHDAATALRVAGGVASAAAGSAAKGNRLAAACKDLSLTGASAADRLTAVRTMERLVLDLFDWPSELVDLGRLHQLGALGKHPDWLRMFVGTLTRELSDLSGRDEFGTKARAVCTAFIAGLPYAPVSLGTALRKPDAQVWERLSQPAMEQRLANGTIHSSKGQEFAAVMVSFRTQLTADNGGTVLDDWANGTNSERRRVIYVGASRAERLLAFGAGPHAERIARILGTTGVSTLLV